MMMLMSKRKRRDNKTNSQNGVAVAALARLGQQLHLVLARLVQVQPEGLSKHETKQSSNKQ